MTLKYAVLESLHPQIIADFVYIFLVVVSLS
jgi:hypothetical protein